MIPFRARTSLLAVLVAASTAPAQPIVSKPVPSEPSKLGPGGTAFPELKPIRSPWDKPGVQKVSEEEMAKYNRAVDELLFKNFPAALPDTATPLQRVRYEQVRNGFRALSLIRQKIQIGNWTPQESSLYSRFVSDVYRTAAELETTPAGRVRCYEVRVIVLKDFERFSATRFEVGTDPQQNWEEAQFYRLQAEADLLTLKAEIQKDAGSPPTAGNDEPGQQPKPDPAYTAFPDQKPPPRKWTQPGWKGNFEEARTEYEKAMDKLLFADVPAALPDNPLLIQKIRFEQVREGLLVLRLLKGRIEVGGWTSFELEQYLNTVADVFRAAAELESDPSRRVRRYEVRVVALKEFEWYNEVGFTTGTAPEQNALVARFRRLEAEADLLKVKSGPWEPRPGLRTPGGVADLPWPPDWMKPPGRRLPPGYTAFPDLRLPPLEKGRAGIDAYRKALDAILFTGIPAALPDEPSTLQKVRHDQVAAGRLAVWLIEQKIAIGNWTPQDYEQLRHLGTEVYRAAAELEPTPAGRVRCLETRVLLFKDFELFNTARYEVGTDAAQAVCRARFDRLQAEAELHELNESLLPPCSAPAPPAVIWCAPACPPQPQGGLFRRR